MNVTWRGKTYVGTLLDCTKHDWAPPRFCESPTSDMESKSNKNSRGKRSRGSNTSETTTDNRIIQSKLRNGKGRRTANSGFTVPASPAKSDSSAPTSSKRKGRPSDLELSPISDSSNNSNNNTKGSKRNRSQTRNTPALSDSSTGSVAQPSSPVLIECPEPNCSKKYKHINGLKYHQTHAHCNDSNNVSIEVNTKDNASDNEDNNPDSISLPSSPTNKIEDISLELNDKLNQNSSTLRSNTVETNENKIDSNPISGDNSSDKSKFTPKPLTQQSIVNSVTTTPSAALSGNCLTSTSEANTSSVANSANTFLVSTQSSFLMEQNSCDPLNSKVDNQIDAKIKSPTAGLPINLRPLASIPPILSVTANLNTTQPLLTTESEVMGTSSEGIKKEKSKHKKKSKDKERDRERERKSSSVTPFDSNTSSIIDSNLSAQSLEVRRTDIELNSSKGSSSGQTSSEVYPSVDLVNTPKVRPLGVESLNNYKDLNSPNNSLICGDSDITEKKLSASEASIENVRSPAYSDISDANDTTPAIETIDDIETIDKSEENLITENPTPDISNQNSPNFRLYPYFNQSQYLIPVGAPESQRSAAGLQDKSGVEPEFPLSVSSKRPRLNSDQSDKSRNEESMGNIKMISESSPLPSNSSPENVHEFGSVNHNYPYPYSYMQRYPGYPMDPTYHMHLLATDPHYKEQCDRYLEQERLLKEQTESKDRLAINETNKRHSPHVINKTIESTAKHSSSKTLPNMRPSSLPSKSDITFDSNPISTNIKEKQSENRQILKENIELKSQMDAIKSRQNSLSSHSSLSSTSFDPMFERQREDKTKRYFMDSLIEHQTKSELDLHSTATIGPPPLLKDGMNRTKSESTKTSSSKHSSSPSVTPSLSSPKPKDILKKEKPNEEKDDKSKIKLKEEGVKPTMETTGPPPPPTNGYYFNPSYLAPHFSPFEHSHPMFRPGSMNPVVMGNPYSSQYLPPQLRYHMSPVAPPSPIGAMDIQGAAPLPGSHSSNEPLTPKMHSSSAQNSKNIDLLHPVSHFGSHKIHELQERALISPTGANTGPHHLPPPPKGGVSSNMPTPPVKSLGSVVSERSNLSSPVKDEATDGKSSDRQRSPPPQRHLHTHHHTHVGVGYPIYDPYSGKSFNESFVL